MKTISKKQILREKPKLSLGFTNWTMLINIIFSFFIMSNSWGQTVKIVSFPAYANFTYSLRSNGVYSNGIETKIGYQLISGNDYYKYRKGLSFNLGSIESYATINSLQLNFDSGVECGSTDGRLVFTRLTWDFPTIFNNETVYNLIRSGTVLDSINIDTPINYNVAVAALIQDIQSAIQTPYPWVGVGIFNRLENSGGGTSFSNIHLVVNYSIPNPPPPTNLALNSITSSSMELSWTASPGNVTGYRVYKDGNLYTTISSSQYQLLGCAQVLNTIFMLSHFLIPIMEHKVPRYHSGPLLLN